MSFRCGLLLMAIVFLAGCFTKQVAQKTGPLVINVLDKALYDDCHIPGSIQVDFDKVERYVSDYKKDHPIIVYCSNYACMTSHFVVNKLLEKGYTQVRVYAGGMAEWYQAGYPVEGSAQQPYLHKKIEFDGSDVDTLSTINTQELAELLKIV
jgi:rhodanese-related sulfurtransferase